MAYVGQAPVNEFAAAPSKDVFTGDASTTTFDLANAVAAGAENAIEVYIDNVRQEPGSGKAFTVGVDGSGDMKRITFTAAPANSAVIYVLNPLTNVQAIAPAITDLNGVELILDADGDSSITADTDDRFDFKISGTDQIQLADGVLKPVTDSDVDLGTSSLYFKDAYIDTVTTTGNVTVGGDLTITGTTSFADTNITNVGSIALDTITNDGTDVTIDSSGDIILDADDTQIFLKDGGTTFGSLTQAGGELVIKSSSSDTTALTFAGANATFAGTLATSSQGVTTGSLGTGTANSSSFLRGDQTWAAAGAITSYTNSTNNRVVTSVDSTTVNSEANLTFDGSTLAVTGAATVSTTLGVTGILTGSAAIIGTTVEPTGDTSASDNAAIGYTSAEGLILTGQGSTNDVTIKNDADADVITIATGATNVDVVGDLTAGTLNADGDTAAGDNAAIGYTAGEGLILTGQGSTTDVTIKNDADATVISIPTGTTNVTVVGNLLPSADDAVDLGSSSYQWRDVYTGDLNLNNTNGIRVNEVDGTSGSWTIQEGDENLFLLNRINGKKYKFNLTEME